MNFKPLRQYSEHDVLNFFKIDTATGSKCTPVVISNSGWATNTAVPNIFENLASSINGGNTYAPRWDITPAVRKAVSGEMPLGITLYDTVETDRWGGKAIYDKQFQVDTQSVPSGVAVPIARKGVFSIGPFPSGENPAPGLFVAVKGTGDIGVTAFATGLVGTISGYAITKPLPVFGQFLGCKDTEGYALVDINCYKY